MLITEKSQRGMVGLHCLVYRGEQVIGRILYFNARLGTALQRQLDGSVKYLEGVRARYVTALSDQLQFGPWF